MEELKPCPICGASAKILNWSNKRFVVECSKNDNKHCVYIIGDTREEAIELWNNQREETCDTILHNNYLKECRTCGHVNGMSNVYCWNCGRKFI